jgi:magnesium transporter
MQKTWIHNNRTQTVAVLTPEQFKEVRPELAQIPPVYKGILEARFCQASHYGQVIFGSFAVPEIKNPGAYRLFGFVLDGDSLYFVDADGSAGPLLKKMEDISPLDGTALNYLLNFMESMINEDIYILQEFDRKLADLEEKLNTPGQGVSDKVFSSMRKDLNILAVYYEQLSNVGETLEDIVVQEGNETAQAMLSLYVSRVQQLYQTTRYVRENLAQVLQLKSDKGQEKQNRNMSILTVVSSIFTPLTFITGWYGMNFKYFPLINDKYGYWINLFICIVILVLEIIIIRHWRILGRKKSK